MEKIKQLDLALPELLKAEIIKYEESKEHLSKGLSQHGKCVGQQILSRIYQKPFTGHGATAPGTGFHEYMQNEVLPTGKMVGDYLILGHEQLIFILDENHKEIRRQSPIDTLVFNTKSKEFEIWDYKTTSIEMQYLHSLDVVYQYQVNLYAQTFKNMLDLPYDPICRVIFVSKNDWTDSKHFIFRSDRQIEEQSHERIALVDAMGKPSEFANAKQFWSQFADGLDIWSDTKKPYRKQCKYCDYQTECLECLNADPNLAHKYESIDQAGDEIYGK